MKLKIFPLLISMMTGHYSLAGASPNGLKDAVLATNQVPVASATNQQLNDAIQALSVAFSAWNPKYNEAELSRTLRERVRSLGVVDGLVGPAVTLIDISYVAGRPEIANLVSPLVSQISPELGETLSQKYGLAKDLSSDIRGAGGFTAIERYRQKISAVLGEPETTESSQSMSRLSNFDPMSGDGAVGYMLSLDRALTGEGSYFQNQRQDGVSDRRGLLSGRDSVAYNNCQDSCMARAATSISRDKESGALVGGVAGTIIGSEAGPPGLQIGFSVGAWAGARMAENISTDYHAKVCTSECNGTVGTTPTATDGGNSSGSDGNPSSDTGNTGIDPKNPENPATPPDQSEADPKTPATPPQSTDNSEKPTPPKKDGDEGMVRNDEGSGNPGDVPNDTKSGPGSKVKFDRQTVSLPKINELSALKKSEFINPVRTDISFGIGKFNSFSIHRN